MYTNTNNNQNLYKWLYNGPHTIRSTAPAGFSITIKNIVFEKEYLEIPNNHNPGTKKKSNSIPTS